MKIIIAGSRDIPEKFVWGHLDDISIDAQFDVVISGAARGPDTWAINYANKYKIPYEEFPADWQHIGKRAGIIRNEEMADYADRLIAFWDGESRGTQHMIRCMQDRKKDYMVFYYK